MIAALVAISMLLAVLFRGIRHIRGDTDFLASVVERNLEMGMQQHAEMQDEHPDDEVTNSGPIGFGVKLRERS